MLLNLDPNHARSQKMLLETGSQVMRAYIAVAISNFFFKGQNRRPCTQAFCMPIVYYPLQTITPKTLAGIWDTTSKSWNWANSAMAISDNSTLDWRLLPLTFWKQIPQEEEEYSPESCHHTSLRPRISSHCRWDSHSSWRESILGALRQISYWR